MATALHRTDKGKRSIPTEKGIRRKRSNTWMAGTIGSPYSINLLFPSTAMATRLDGYERERKGMERGEREKKGRVSAL